MRKKREKRVLWNKNCNISNHLINSSGHLCLNIKNDSDRGVRLVSPTAKIFKMSAANVGQSVENLQKKNGKIHLSLI
jgi:hypothetical protein